MSATAEPDHAVADAARTVVLEAGDPRDVDWEAASLWRVLVTHERVPVSSLWVPAPGRLARPQAFTRALVADGLLAAEYWAAYERYRQRMGLGERRYERPTVSVIVCTHRRSEYLPGLLAGVRALEPAPDEVIVVDNAPGELDSRAVIEAAGARYVREDRKGLDHARTAGVRAATGELLAFTDDDCVPSERWLADLGELFADPSVGGVTGPAFAYELNSPAQLRFELEGGFGRGMRRRAWDWTAISPLDAGAVGAGANMIFRRDVLARIGDPFPAELDAGTPTESGGDMYAIYKVLEAGMRVVYDPGTYVFHRHRRDPAALHHAFFGYGVGLSAVMAKLLVEEGELAAPHTWGWLWRNYRSALLRRAAGTADPRSLRVAWDYLRGGFFGPQAWVRARREIAPAPLAAAGSAPASDRPAEAVPVPPSPPAHTAPELSIIVPTADRPAALRRCLAALAAQACDAPFEVVVVDDRGGVPEGDGYRLVRGERRGAAAARNAGAAAARGRLLLFLDDDLVPEPGLVSLHAARHAAEGDGAIVIGYSPPAPPDPGLAEKAAALWWHEHFDLLGDTAEPTFADMLSGNMSVERALFERLGGFDEALGRMRREDWLFGFHAISAGARVVYERGAVAAHEFALPTRRRLRAAREEGHGDAVLVARHPELGAALAKPFAQAGLSRRGPLWALSLAVPRLLDPITAVLDALERAHLRGWWMRAFRIAQLSAYAAGRREGERALRAAGDTRPARSGDAPGARRGASTRRLVRSAGADPLPPPGPCALPFDLDVPGRRPVRISPSLGRWNRLVAHDAAAAEQRRRPSPAADEPVLPANVAVLFGPAHEERAEFWFRRGHAHVVRAGGDPAEHWAALGAAVTDIDAERIVITMPGVTGGTLWLRRATETIDGDRVAVVLGHSPRRRDAEQAPYLRSRRQSVERYATLDDPFHYVVLHRERFLELGGFADGLEALGPYAAPLELAERALDAGLVVMHQRVGGLRVPPRPWRPWERREWDRQRARGALLAREGAAAAARGAFPLASDVLRRRVPPHVGAGRLAAYVSGVPRGSTRQR